MNDFELHGWRWQILCSGEPDGLPYRYPGRCLERVRWLNTVAGELRYTLKPVRMRGDMP
jgi:hypothetical protein